MKIPPPMTPTSYEEEWRKAQQRARAGEAQPKPQDGVFHFEWERLLNVIRALEAGDLSDCKAPDVKHTIQAMTRVFMLANLSPDFFDGFMDIATRHFAAMHHKAVIGEWAQKYADAEGFGQQWREAIEAGNSPKQKDYMAKIVAVIMKSEGLNQEQAIAKIAEQSGRGNDSTGKNAVENIRRTVTRSKSRSKSK